MKKNYSAPVIRKTVPVIQGSAILAGSVVDKDTTVETAGQKVEERDMSGAAFNHDWE